MKDNIKNTVKNGNQLLKIKSKINEMKTKQQNNTREIIDLSERIDFETLISKKFHNLIDIIFLRWNQEETDWKKSE